MEEKLIVTRSQIKLRDLMPYKLEGETCNIIPSIKRVSIVNHLIMEVSSPGSVRTPYTVMFVAVYLKSVQELPSSQEYLRLSEGLWW